MRERKARLCGDILRRGGAANKTKKKSAGGSKSNMSSVSGLNSVGGVDSPLAGPVPSVVQTGAKKVKKQPAISAADAKLTTSEEKKQRRIIRNRQAAQLHRDRKARALLDLQTSLAQKESENAILRATLFKVKSLVSPDDWEMLSREMSSASSSSSTSISTDSMSCSSDEEKPSSPTLSATHTQPNKKRKATSSNNYSAGGIVKLGMMAGLGLCAMIGVMNSGSNMNMGAGLTAPGVGVDLNLARGELPGLTSPGEAGRRKLVEDVEEVETSDFALTTTTTTTTTEQTHSYAISPIENIPSLWGTPPWYYSSSHSLYAMEGGNSTATGGNNLRGGATSRALVPAQSKSLTNYIYAPTARARIQSLLPAVVDPKRVNVGALEEQLLTILLPSSSVNDYDYGEAEDGRWLEMQCKVIEVKEIWDVDFR